MTRADWVRVTTGALETYRRSGNRAWYRHQVLSWWNAYRPNGPLPGEETPNEVEKLRREPDDSTCPI
jgi:hypothetical protein